jgi:hypothetical protein
MSVATIQAEVLSLASGERAKLKGHSAAKPRPNNEDRQEQTGRFKAGK